MYQRFVRDSISIEYVQQEQRVLIFHRYQLDSISYHRHYYSMKVD